MSIPPLPVRDDRGRFLPRHNHVDKAMRPEGCKACDLIWLAQRRRVTRTLGKPTDEIDDLIDDAMARPRKERPVELDEEPMAS
jgi:hypothetical protein